MGHTAFTIVCAVYNAEAYLDELLESIFEKQNYQSKDLFFIAVDDGSIDNSLRIIEVSSNGLVSFQIRFAVLSKKTLVRVQQETPV